MVQAEDQFITKNNAKCGNEAPTVPFCGPMLRFQGFDPANNHWTISVLVVVADTYNTDALPQLDVDGHGDFPGVKIGDFNGYCFWRFEFSVELDDHERRHTYSLQFSPELPGAAANYSFVAPAVGEQLHWAFKSCDWFSGGVKEEERQAMGGYEPVWNDILDTHEKQPLHVMVAGGDQLYCDPIFLEVPELIEWSKMSKVRDMKDMKAAKVDGNTKHNIESWYFNHYMKSFGRPKVADVLAQIPNVMMWDDHDIFDGWGSYPKSLQESPTFQAVYKAGERFYLLFQQHTTFKLAPSHGFIGSPSFHYVKQLTPECAVLGMDCRAQRTLEHVMTQEAYNTIFPAIHALPDTVKHLIVVSAVPVVYPEVPFSESGLRCIGFWSKHSYLWATMKKRNTTGSFLKFDEPELLDDLIDHWGSSVHKKERKVLIRKFQEYAAAKGVRCSFISGDVHLASVGLLYGNPKKEDPKQDPRWMLNVTSSASVNVPPPNALVGVMTKSNRASMVDTHTKEKMVRMFKDVPNAQSDKLMPKRNWCDVITMPASGGGDTTFKLRVEPEGSSPKKSGFAEYTITAPLLLTKPTGAPYKH